MFQREGAYTYLWLIHVDVWQKPTQYCKAIILQLKINEIKKNPPKFINEKRTSTHTWVYAFTTRE